jgi:hypothetical protein
MEAATGSKEYSTSIRVTNSFTTPISFWFEPWGDMLTMPPGATYLVIAQGPEGDGFEVNYRRDGITVWLWPGSTGSVLDGETVLLDYKTAPRIPEVPQGKSVRGFLEPIFGEGLLRPEDKGDNC